MYDMMAEFCEGEAVALSDEVAQTARITKPAAGVVYGPLWQFPLQPDLVVVWATIIQAVVLQEVAGAVMWRNNPQGAVFTRPACSVLPIAMPHDKASLSLGCVGVRTYTQIPDGVYLLALPGSRLDQLKEHLKKIENPGERLQFYSERLRAGMAQEGQP